MESQKEDAVANVHELPILPYNAAIVIAKAITETI